MDSKRFQDKVMVVTGGTSGIGKAVCLRAGAEGAIVVTAGRNEERGKAIEKEIIDQGGKALFIQCDVTKKEDIIHLYAKTMEVYGHLDIAINNAGIVGDSKKIEDLTINDLLPIENFIKYSKVVADEKMVKDIKNGKQLFLPYQGNRILLMNGDEALAIYEYIDNIYKMKRGLF